MGEDLELLQAWRGGDRGAGSRLLRRHFESLHRFFASKIEDDAAAEDLIQNTMLACVTYIDKVAAAASFKAYLFTIASNQLYAYLRRNLREGRLIDFTQASAVELGLSPSAVVALRERDQQLSVALRTLPLELQLVLELGYWEGLNAREIATVLEVPLGTAKSKIRRAKQLLAAALERLDRGSPTGRSGPSPEAGDEDELGAWVRELRDAFTDVES